MENKIFVRKATLTDAQLLADFMTLQAFETEKKTLDPELIKEGIRGLFDRPQCGQYYVAEENEIVIGMIMIHHEMNLSLGGFVHWINSVYVHPDHRQKGVFRLLYDHVRSVAENGYPLVKCIRLYVDLDNVVAQ